MVHISRIYTRSGDEGQTGRGDGARVSKTHPGIVAGGALDEANCLIGLAISAGPQPELTALLTTLQQLIFDMGADLCFPWQGASENAHVQRISKSHHERLEQIIDQFNSQLSPLNSFVLPGGHPAAAWLHLARSVCRRAEVECWRLQELEGINPDLLIALNRLSDLLFVLARVANDNGRTDVLWKPGVVL